MKVCFCLLAVLLSGCSFLPSFHDAPKPKTETVKAQHQVPQHTSVAPEARKLMTEAQALCSDSWSECKNAQKALNLLDKAVSIDPLDARAWLLRSRALGDLGYLDDAIDDATKAIRLAPSAEAYATRGSLLQKRNQHAGAKRDLDYAKKLDPTEPLTYVFLAAEDFLENEMSKGCANLRQACEYGLCSPHDKAADEGICR